jgi:TonB family protein
MKKTILIALLAVLSYQVGNAQTTTPTEEKTYPFVALESPPKFPGGINKFYEFLANNIQFPKEAIKRKIRGNVFVSFVIEKDGSVTNVEVVRGLGGGTDEEAVRVLKLSPKWEPGMQDGKPVKVRYNIPIKFS